MVISSGVQSVEYGDNKPDKERIVCKLQWPSHLVLVMIHVIPSGFHLLVAIGLLMLHAEAQVLEVYNTLIGSDRFRMNTPHPHTQKHKTMLIGYRKRGNPLPIS